MGCPTSWSKFSKKNYSAQSKKCLQKGLETVITSGGYKCFKQQSKVHLKLHFHLKELPVLLIMLNNVQKFSKTLITFDFNKYGTRLIE